MALARKGSGPGMEGEGEAAQVREWREPLPPHTSLLPLSSPGWYERMETPQTTSHKWESVVWLQAGEETQAELAAPSGCSCPHRPVPAYSGFLLFSFPPSIYLALPIGAIPWQLPSGSLSRTMMGPKAQCAGQMMDVPPRAR